MNVNITIDHVVDVDLLTVDADFILSYTPPAWFAADLFNRTKRVDWLELLAQLQWVIYCNQQVVQAIGSQPALQALADRFRDIVSMYQCLCDTALIDLDLPIESATTYSDIVKADSEDSWSWLRQLYSRTNRLKILNAANDAFSSNAESAQKIENLKPNTVLLGLNLLDVNVESRDTDLADDSNNLKISAIRAAHHLTALTQAGLYGIKMQTLTGAYPGSPAVLFLVNSIDIENSDHGDVVGIFADNINGISGIRAEINLHIETFTNSTLIGAAAGNGPYKFPLPGQHSVQSPPEVAKSPAL